MELGIGYFGDARLQRNGEFMMERVVERQTVCLRNLADNRAEQAKLRRFLANDSVTVEEMVSSRAMFVAAAAAGKAAPGAPGSPAAPGGRASPVPGAPGVVGRPVVVTPAVCCVPWDNAGAYLRFSATYLARDEPDEDELMAETVARLGRLELRF